jgi:hypothetical protein
MKPTPPVASDFGRDRSIGICKLTHYDSLAAASPSVLGGPLRPRQSQPGFVQASVAGLIDGLPEGHEFDYVLLRMRPTAISDDA